MFLRLLHIEIGTIFPDLNRVFSLFFQSNQKRLGLVTGHGRLTLTDLRDTPLSLNMKMFYHHGF